MYGCAGRSAGACSRLPARAARPPVFSAGAAHAVDDRRRGLLPRAWAAHGRKRHARLAPAPAPPYGRRASRCARSRAKVSSIFLRLKTLRRNTGGLRPGLVVACRYRSQAPSALPIMRSNSVMYGELGDRASFTAVLPPLVL